MKKKKNAGKSPIKKKIDYFLSQLTPWLGPLFFSIFPVLAIYTHNIDQLDPSRLLVPLLYSILFMVISCAVVFTFYGNKNKTVVFTSIWILLFFSYGYIYLELADLIPSNYLPLSLNKLLLASYLALLTAVAIILKRWKQTFDKIVPVFTVAGSVLVLVNLITIIPFEVQRIASANRLKNYINQNLSSVSTTENSLKPDIYYFVFDRYGRQDILQNYLNYSNESHIQYLENEGFFVGHKSSANYPNTFISLSSSLNMTYLDFLEPTMGEQQRDRVAVYNHLIEDNYIARILKSQGYNYTLSGSAWDPTRVTGISDTNINDFSNFDEFHLYIYERTLFNTIRGLIEDNQLYTGVERLNKMGHNLPYRIENINYQSQQDTPQFIFAHFLMPHDPHVFDSDCSPLAFEEIRNNGRELGYTKELECANTVMANLIEQIKNREPYRPSVIIFQSDEGPYLPIEFFPTETEVLDSQEARIIHSGILNALYLPDKDNPDSTADYAELGLSPQSTPVNTFRVILNYYFGSELPLLEDKVYYFQSVQSPYVFNEVTSELNQESSNN